MDILKFPWDGSNIGDIDHLISKFDIIDKRVILTFIDESKAYATKHTNTICLIADELKPYFGMDKIGRCVCIINGTLAIIHRIIGIENNLSDVDFDVNVNHVRKVFIFRWFLGLIRNYDASIMIRQYKSGIYSIISLYDNMYDYDREFQGSNIPKTAKVKWFNDEDAHNNMARYMLSNYTFIEIRSIIDRVIKRIDREHSLWSIAICSRLSQYITNEPIIRI